MCCTPHDRLFDRLNTLQYVCTIIFSSYFLSRSSFYERTYSVHTRHTANSIQSHFCVCLCWLLFALCDVFVRQHFDVFFCQKQLKTFFAIFRLDICEDKIKFFFFINSNTNKQINMIFYLITKS